MRTSPRRPLILKRRKLTLLQKEVSSTSGRDENSGHDEKTPKQEHSQNDQNDSQCRDKIDCGLQIFSAGIKIMNHPTMPNTQVVAPECYSLHACMFLFLAFSFCAASGLSASCSWSSSSDGYFPFCVFPGDSYCELYFCKAVKSTNAKCLFSCFCSAHLP